LVVQIEMKFGELVRRLQEGDDRLYLTTQSIADGEFEPLHLFGAPLTHLAADFPLRPALLGHLGAL